MLGRRSKSDGKGGDGGRGGEQIGRAERVPAERRAHVTSFAGSGTGVRLNPALRAIFESRLGMRLNVPRHREETSFGAALLAGISTGALRDLTEAGALVCYEDY